MILFSKKSVNRICLAIIGGAVLSAGCMGSGRAAYYVGYPFVPSPIPRDLTEVKVRVDNPTYHGDFNQSVGGSHSFRAIVISGRIPKHERLNKFKINVLEHGATEYLSKSGGGEIILRFNKDGKLVMVKEFADSWERLPRTW